MYVKLFASLYQGTLRGCSDEILVFTNLLAHADQHGIVDKHWRAIAEETGLSRERVEASIVVLETPDPESRSPENEGRRIIKMDEHRAWGWQIVNYGKYRAIRSEDDRREQNRIAQDKFRNKNKPISKQSKPPSAQAEAEAEGEAEGEAKEIKPKPTVATLPEFLNSEVWESFRRHRGKKFTANAQELVIKKLAAWRDQGQDPNAILENSIANGWQGVFEEKHKGQTNGRGYESERDKSRRIAVRELTGYDPDAIKGVSTRID